MKKITTLLLAIAMASCSSDKNKDKASIGALKLENLIHLETNIPQDFYDDLTFTDAQTGYAISRLGKIVKTTDAGITWTTLNSGATQPLKRIHFVNHNLGFAIGSDPSGNFVLRTNNAGQTWTSINLTSTSNSSLNSIYFINETVGFIVGNQVFKKTSNGGLSWSDVFTTPTDKNFQDIKFKKQSNIGYATANTNEYYKTTDGGISWTAIQTNFREENFSQIQLIDEQVYLKSNSKVINVSSGRTAVLPNPVNKILLLDHLKSIGIGQHYEGGFFPFGDILLTNDNWTNFLQKTYQPSSEAMDFTALAKLTNHKVMILGTGQLHTEVIMLEIE
ncbi:hypothetical protein G4D82_10240 [Flavobacterium sp. CYK-4]|uniref:YCF48-related protein n=1 Tax=Flavobacterium lotistagni TaxID=2709660 RepID=UPI00140AD620|nr:YCF48-related protein [Flavobacterium lotistagni]NHM07601.1 hypothetical protein [Flavobacterium lotistagni]